MKRHHHHHHHQSLLLLLLPTLLLYPSTSAAATFTCASSNSTCQSLIGYTNPNATTLSHIKSLFQVKSLRALLSVNNLPLPTHPSLRIPPNSTTRIRFTCRCLNGSGSATRMPLYVVRPGDGLDSIARYTFGGLVTFQEIASASNISDPNIIQVGQRLRIPLPCSCDEVDGRDVVHYGHVVAPGSSLAEIGSEFGVTQETLLRLNGIKDPKTLQAGQVLDVPLRACSSSISNTSLDRGLLVTNDSYVLTANNCVLCSCSSVTWQLECSLTKGLSSTTCPAAKCGNLYLGNASTISSCEHSVCSYSGYTNTTILTSLATQSSCNSGIEPAPQESSGFSLRPNWVEILIFLHAWIYFCAFC